MHFNVSKEINSAGNAALRITFYVKRSHERIAKRARIWVASKKDAQERVHKLKGILKKRGMDGLADEVFGKVALPEGRANIGAAAGEFVRAKELAGRAWDSVCDLRSRLRRLAELFPSKFVHEVQARDLQGALERVGKTPQSRLNYFRVWRNFFNWCWRNGLVSQSPMFGVEAPSVERKLPVFASAEGIERLVEAARVDNARSRGFNAARQGVLLPWVLLCFFSGVRPEEAARLRRGWEDFNFDRGEIVLGENVTKVSRVRIVRLSAELAECLQILRERGFAPGFFSRRVFERVRVAAGIKWAPDIGRHSYASYSFALGVPEAELVMDMGNSVAVLRRHYINRLASRSEAERWRGIVPGLLVTLRRHRGRRRG